jgi:hypothetical protein
MFRRGHVSTSAIALCVLAALVLALAPGAQARTITINWVERTSADFGYQPMTFKVTTVVITAKAWAVRASVTNRSRRALNIVAPADTYPPQYTFGLGWGKPCAEGTHGCGLQTLRRTYSKPALPRTLRPGQTWKGVFGGPGKPVRGKLINVTFGFFVAAGEQDGFSWISQRSFRL